MKKATAQTTLKITCDCPHCGAWLEIFNQAKEHLGKDLRATDINLGITCEECGEEFEVTEILY